MSPQLPTYSVVVVVVGAGVVVVVVVVEVVVVVVVVVVGVVVVDVVVGFLVVVVSGFGPFDEFKEKIYLMRNSCNVCTTWRPGAGGYVRLLRSTGTSSAAAR